MEQIRSQNILSYIISNTHAEGGKNEADNLRTLCTACHDEIHSQVRYVALSFREAAASVLMLEPQSCGRDGTTCKAPSEAHRESLSGNRRRVVALLYEAAVLQAGRTTFRRKPLGASSDPYASILVSGASSRRLGQFSASTLNQL